MATEVRSRGFHHDRHRPRHSTGRTEGDRRGGRDGSRRCRSRGGVAVTEVALQWIEFSLLLGIPAGLAAGVVVAVAVLLGLTEDAPAGRRRAATALGGFGATFLVVLVAAASVGGQGVVVSLVAAAVVGVVVGVGTYAYGGGGEGGTRAL